MNTNRLGEYADIATAAKLELLDARDRVGAAYTERVIAAAGQEVPDACRVVVDYHDEGYEIEFFHQEGGLLADRDDVSDDLVYLLISAYGWWVEGPGEASLVYDLPANAAAAARETLRATRPALVALRQQAARARATLVNFHTDRIANLCRLAGVDAVRVRIYELDADGEGECHLIDGSGSKLRVNLERSPELLKGLIAALELQEFNEPVELDLLA